MQNKNINIKMLDVKYIFLKNEYTISSRSRLRIQSIQDKYKLIKFNDGKKRKASKSIDKKIPWHI